MTPDPTLTDEELAEIEQCWNGQYLVKKNAIPRLIAALRASREEVERLSEQNDGLYQATLMLGKEVERLRLQLREAESDASLSFRVDL